MKQRRASLQVIADELGIAKMTVSRYLKDPALVSTKLGNEIQDVLDKYHYIPNRLPTLLSGAESKIIGVLLPSLTNSVFADVLRGIEKVADEYGYQTMLGHYGYDKLKEETRLMSLLSFNIDGVILSERDHSHKTKQLLKANRIPVVEIMDSITPALDMYVGFDNEAAAYEMTSRIIRSGKQKIAYFGARHDERTLIKERGYLRAIAEANLTPYSYLSKAPSSVKLGAEILSEVITAFPGLDGIFCTNDDLAIGALFECQRRGYLIPKDIAIAGFHGHDMSQSMSPKLASVLTPRYQIGQYAAKLLFSRFNQSSITSDKGIDLGYEIAIGESI